VTHAAGQSFSKPPRWTVHFSETFGSKPQLQLKLCPNVFEQYTFKTACKCSDLELNRSTDSGCYSLVTAKSRRWQHVLYPGSFFPLSATNGQSPLNLI
jgi:hypothetical protein